MKPDQPAEQPATGAFQDEPEFKIAAFPAAEGPGLSEEEARTWLSRAVTAQGSRTIAPKEAPDAV